MPVGDFAIADLVIGLVVVVSTVFGVMRGFVKEVVSLAIWAAAFLLGLAFGSRVGELMALELEPKLQTAIGFAAVFIAVLVVGAIVQRALHGLIETTGLTGTDRLLGMLFGAGRGVIVVAVALIALRPFAENRQWWDDSRLVLPLLEFEDDILAVFDSILDARPDESLPVSVGEVSIGSKAVPRHLAAIPGAQGISPRRDPEANAASAKESRL